MPGFLGEELTKRQQEALKKSQERLKKEQEKLKKATTSTSSTKGNSGAKTGTTKNATQVRSSIESNKSVSKKQVQNYVANSAQRVATKTVPPVTRNAIQVRSSIESNKPASRQAINNTVARANKTFGQNANNNPWYGNIFLNGLYSASINTQKALLRTAQNAYDFMKGGTQSNNWAQNYVASNGWSQSQNEAKAKKDYLQDFFTAYDKSLTRDQEKLQSKASESIGDSGAKGFVHEASQALGKVIMEIPLLLGGPGEAKASLEAVSATGKLLNALKELPKNPVTWFRSAETYGRTYDQSIAEGATPEEANQRAVMLAFIMPATETLGGADAALRSIGGTKGLMGLLKGAAIAGGSEAIEEPGQGMIEAASRNVYTDVPLASMEDQNAIINPNRMAYESALGATVGAIAGGATTGISNAVNRIGTVEPVQQLEQDPIVRQELEQTAINEQAPWGPVPRSYAEVDASLMANNDIEQRVNTVDSNLEAQERMGQINPKISKTLLKDRMFDLFGIRSGKKNAAKNSLNAVVDKIVTTGEYTKADRNVLFSDMIELGATIDDTSIELYDTQEAKNFLKGTKVYLDDSVIGDLGGWSPSKMMQFRPYVILTRNKANRGIDDIYNEMSEIYPHLFPQEETSPSRQLGHILDVVSKKDEYVSITQYISELNGEDAEMFIDELDQELSAELRTFGVNVTVERMSKDEISQKIQKAENVKNQKRKEQKAKQEVKKPITQNINRRGQTEYLTNMMKDGLLGIDVNSLSPKQLNELSHILQNRKTYAEGAKELYGYPVPGIADEEFIKQVSAIAYPNGRTDIVPVRGGTANVLTSIEKESKPVGDRLKHTYHDFKQKMVDSGEAVSRLSKQTGNKNLYAAFNNARQSSASADSMILEKQRTKQGQEIGEGLNSIFEPIFKRGDGYVSDFYSYLYHIHNIDRMAQGKPVFGETVSADMSRQEAAVLLQKHPEFSEYAEKVYQYERGLMEWRVDSGIYSKEEAGLFQTLYPNYVPTHRKIDSGEMFRQAGVRDIQKAKGSDIDLMPIYEQMIMQTRAVVRNARMNDFKQSLLNSAGNDMVQVASEPQAKSDIASDIENEITDNPDNDVVVWVDGKRILLAVDDDVQFALDNIRSNFKDNAIATAAREANNGFKKLVTSWSPMFLARNFMRDVQDGVFYSKNPASFAKNIPIAMTDIARNTELFQQYKSMGAFQSSFFEYDPSVQVYKQHSAIKKNTLDRIERVNFMVEQAPRFAEFKSTLEKYSDGKVESLDGFTMDQIQEAMYNAADVTVNFGRSGTWGRAINSYAVPFFNASVQGTSKALRMVTQNPTSIRAWGSLALRVGLLSIPMSMANYLLYEDDEEYQAFPNRDKNLYFFIRYEGENGEAEWLKIPKGRITGAIGSLAVNVARVANGESFEDAFADYGQTLKESVAPINPFTGNLWAGIDAVARTGKTWYGGDIESQSMQNLPPGQRYDEKTTSVARWLGEKTNFSPKKIDYLFDAYGGAIEEMIAPYLTPTSRDGYFQNAFKVDPTYSNKYLSKFYDLKEEVTYDKNDKENQGDNEADVTYRYVNSISSVISDLNSQIKEIESGSGSDKEKREQVAEIKQQINALAQSVTENIDAYKTAAQKYFASTGDIDMAYVYANKEVFGVQYALENYPYRPDLWSDASAAQEAVGLDPWSFSEMLITASGFTSSKDANGDTIDGQAKKDKVIDYVSGLDISDEQKDYFFYDVMGYTRNKPVEWGGGSSSNGSYAPAPDDMSYDEKFEYYKNQGTAETQGTSETSLSTKSYDDMSYDEKFEYLKSGGDPGSSYSRPVSGNITATFGQKGSIWPSGSHHGLDFSAPVGTSCKAVQDGTVTKIMRDYNGSIYGNRIEITHADGTVTSYSHLSNIGVENGDTVSSGQVIGKTGNTGNVSGAHLHFEVIVDGQLVDPQDYYSFN